LAFGPTSYVRHRAGITSANEVHVARQALKPPEDQPKVLPSATFRADASLVTAAAHSIRAPMQLERLTAVLAAPRRQR